MPYGRANANIKGRRTLNKYCFCTNLIFLFASGQDLKKEMWMPDFRWFLRGVVFWLYLAPNKQSLNQLSFKKIPDGMSNISFKNRKVDNKLDWYCWLKIYSIKKRSLKKDNKPICEPSCQFFCGFTVTFSCFNSCFCLGGLHCLRAEFKQAVKHKLNFEHVLKSH